MSATVVVHTTVKDPEKFKVYAESAGPIVASHGGEFLFRGKVAQVLAGTHGHQNVAMIKFADQAAVKKWYESPEYQALIPNRDEAADMIFISCDG